MKISFLYSLLIFISFDLNAINVTIIESQSGSQWACQDIIWHNVALGMGYSSNVSPQSTLDNISNLNTTDILVVSSGTISFTNTNHLQTIIQYVLNGGSCYIQSEYLTSFQGCITFKSIMQTLGADFDWTITVAGSNLTVNVLGILSNIPNSVSSLGSVNYGLAGTGSGVEKFLEYNGNYFGFYYSDINSINGSVISISDQDWAWQNSSPALMENILFRLSDQIPTSLNNSSNQNRILQFSPNPCSDKLTVTLISKIDSCKVELFDLFGRKYLLPTNYFGSSIVLDVENLRTNVYIFVLTINNKILYSDKLLVFH